MPYSEPRCCTSRLSPPLGIFFLNPAGATCAPDRLFDTVRQLTPTTSRRGDGFFAMRRSGYRTVSESSIPDEFVALGASDSSFRRLQFAGQLTETLRRVQPGNTACLYTHLGNIDTYLWRDRFRDLLDYSEKERLGEKIAPLERSIATNVAFLPVSLMNQYLWMRANASSVCRFMENEEDIDFQSFYDRILQRKIELRPRHLYGLSFRSGERARGVFCNGHPCSTVGVKKGIAPFVRVVEGLRHFSLQDYLRFPARKRPWHTGFSRAWRLTDSRVRIDFRMSSTVRVPLGNLLQICTPNYLLVRCTGNRRWRKNFRFELATQHEGRTVATLDLEDNEYFSQTSPQSGETIYVPLYVLINSVIPRERICEHRFNLLVSRRRRLFNAKLELNDIAVAKAVVGPPPRFNVVLGEADPKRGASRVRLTMANGAEVCAALSNNANYVLKAPAGGPALLEWMNDAGDAVWRRRICVRDTLYLGPACWDDG